jgi:hypothetical protein
MVGSAGGGDCVCRAEYRRRESGFVNIAVVVLRPDGAVRRDRGAGSFQDWCAGQRRDPTDHLDGRHSGRASDLHVELHGLGQCLDHCHRS